MTKHVIVRIRNDLLTVDISIVLSAVVAVVECLICFVCG